MGNGRAEISTVHIRSIKSHSGPGKPFLWNPEKTSQQLHGGQGIEAF